MFHVTAKPRSKIHIRNEIRQEGLFDPVLSYQELCCEASRQEPIGFCLNKRCYRERIVQKEVKVKKKEVIEYKSRYGELYYRQAHHKWKYHPLGRIDSIPLQKIRMVWFTGDDRIVKRQTDCPNCGEKLWIINQFLIIREKSHKPLSIGFCGNNNCVTIEKTIKTVEGKAKDKKTIIKERFANYSFILPGESNAKAVTKDTKKIHCSKCKHAIFWSTNYKSEFLSASEAREYYLKKRARDDLNKFITQKRKIIK